MLNVMGCSADPPLVSLATSSTTIPVVGSVSTGNPQSQVSTILSGSAPVNMKSGKHEKWQCTADRKLEDYDGESTTDTGFPTGGVESTVRAL